MQGLGFKKAMLLLVIVSMLVAFTPQEAKVNQRKIDRERVRQEKEAQKQFNKALKRHNDIQTKETRKRMKQSKKASKKVTPIKH
jgi:Na+-translocating ferredoxin:NAD+ oxidoreductase RnfG subunit